MYVFGRAPIDVKACAAAFDGIYCEPTDSNSVLVSDVIYQYAVGGSVEVPRYDDHTIDAKSNRRPNERDTPISKQLHSFDGGHCPD